jgi:molecular chaperone DnaK (HSP70)
VLLDVIPLSLGLETSGGMMAKIIEKNCSIPTEKSQMFSTTEDDQSVVSIKVFEGERPFTEHNHFLGSFDLTGLEALPRGVAKIEVTFAIDENGILSVSAVDKRTGMSNNVTISNDSGRLSQEEISRMLREADKNISNDEARKQVKEEYKSFVKYLQAMRDSLNGDEAKSCLSYDEITRGNAYIIEVFQFLEENKDELLIDRLRGYREETESNIGPLVYKIYERNKMKKVELSEEEIIQKINNL